MIYMKLFCSWIFVSYSQNAEIQSVCRICLFFYANTLLWKLVELSEMRFWGPSKPIKLTWQWFLGLKLLRQKLQAQLAVFIFNNGYVQNKVGDRSRYEFFEILIGHGFCFWYFFLVIRFITSFVTDFTYSFIGSS